MAYKTYKPESLQIPGINLPAWFNSVDPLTFGEASGERLGLEKLELSNQQAEADLAEKERKKKAAEALASKIIPEDLDNPEEFLKKVKQSHLESQDYEAVVDDLKQEALYKQQQAKKDKPSVSNFGNGYVMITNPDGTYRFEQGPAGMGGGKEKKPPSIDMDYWDEGTGAGAKININDPEEVRRAKELKLKPGKPPEFYDPLTYLKEKEEAEAKKREEELKQGQPGLLAKLWNGMTAQGERPKTQGVVDKKKADKIPKAK